MLKVSKKENKAFINVIMVIHGDGGLVAKSCLSLAIPCTVAHRLLCSWTSPGKNTGVGSPSLLQGNFQTQGSNLSLLCCRWSSALQVGALPLR